MKQVLIIALCATSLATAVPVPTEAAQIKSACMASDRSGATRQRCKCIQRVADNVLTRGDQNTVAKWFSNPNKAQEVKMSNSSRDDALWERYQAFGQMAKAACS